MPDIYQVELPSGSVYDLKDAKAREDIESIRQSIGGGVTFLGITNTEITDGSKVSPVVIDGENVTPVNGGLAIYGDDEFIYSSVDSSWHRFGPAGTFKSLAFKDEASGTFTPSGSVSKPTVTVNPLEEAIQTIDSVGTLPSWSATVQNERLTFSWAAGTTPTKKSAQNVVIGIDSVSVSDIKFTGTSDTVTVS